MTAPSFPQYFEISDGQRLTIDKIRPEEIQQVFDFLLIHFLPVPPFLQLCPDYNQVPKESRSPPAWIWEWTQQCVNQPFSLLVRNEDGQIVAVILNAIEQRPSTCSTVDPTEECELLIFECLAQLFRGVSFFEIFEADRLFHLAIVAVSSDYGHNGVAARLYQLTLDIAAASGVKVIKQQAFSQYTLKLGVKFGFTNYKTLDYANFTYKGAQPLAQIDMGLHQAVHLMARPTV